MGSCSVLHVGYNISFASQLNLECWILTTLNYWIKSIDIHRLKCLEYNTRKSIVVIQKQFS